MKRNELMIGDWVAIVRGLSKGYIKQLIETRELVLATNYKPIPLTEEILTANGFGRDKSHVEFANIIGDYVIIYNTAVGRLSIDFEHINNGKGVPKSIVSIPLRYVHELQHALRLCGLITLADNFKVE